MSNSGPGSFIVQFAHRPRVLLPGPFDAKNEFTSNLQFDRWKPVVVLTACSTARWKAVTYMVSPSRPHAPPVLLFNAISSEIRAAGAVARSDSPKYTLLR